MFAMGQHSGFPAQISTRAPGQSSDTACDVFCIPAPEELFWKTTQSILNKLQYSDKEKVWEQSLLGFACFLN